MTNAKTLSEDDISVKFVTPGLHHAGGDEKTQIRRQVFFSRDRIIVRGKLVAHGKAKLDLEALLHEALDSDTIEHKAA